MKKFCDFICQKKWLIIIVSLLLLIPSIIGYVKTKINYDILVYLPDDIETLKGEHILTDDFKMGSFSITIVDNMSDKEIIELERNFREIDGVENVISINDITGTTIPIEVIPSDIRNKMVNGNSKLVLVTFADSTSADRTLDAVDEMRKMVDERVKIGGMSAMVLDTKELFNSQMLLYVVIAVICSIIILMISLDSFAVPFLLIANIGLAILYNMGSNIIFGEISYITKAIAAVLQLGVTTDFSIFLYHKYEAYKKEKKTKEEAMSCAIQETMISVIGSSLTTIAGFLALCSMKLTLGSDIGIVMSKGVVFGVITVLTLFPSLLLIFDKAINKSHHKSLAPKFKQVKPFVLKHYKLIFIMFLILIIPAYLSQKHTDVYYKLDTSIPDDYGYTIATTKLQNDYGMNTQELIIIDANKSNIEVNKMVDEISNLDGISSVLSSSMLSKHGIAEDIIPSKLRNIYETNKYKLILVNSDYEIASNELNNQVDVLNEIVKKYDNNAIVAGEGPLMRDLVNITDTDFKNVNFVSIGVIFLIMFFVLKSISLPVLLVTGIEFAIFINMGVPYWHGTSIPFISSVVIGTIQLGATIDYAILMTTKYLEERKNGKSKKEAVGEAISTSVPSIFVSAMCFFAATGAVYAISKIDMIGSLCLLMARGAIISMLVVMFIIPSILYIFDKIIIKTTLGFKKGMVVNEK